MTSISEYDVRQLRLMYGSLISFEKRQIGLDELTGTLTFLSSVMELVDAEWWEEFSNEYDTLETIHSVEIIKSDNEEIFEISPQKKETLLKEAVQKLKKLVESKLPKDVEDETGQTF